MSYGQHNSLKAFSRKQYQRDSLENAQLRDWSNLYGQQSFFVDSIGKRSYQLFKSEEGEFAYRTSLNLQAAISTGASHLTDSTKGFRLLADSIICGVWDDGLVADHIEFGNRILSKQGNGFYDHSTHVTGTLLASGINTLAKGMAPNAQAYTFDYNNDLSEMTAMASEDDKGLLFSNHSYGTVTGWSKPNGIWTWFGDASISTDEDYRHGFYNQRARNTDALAYLSPYYTIVWAAGNDRFESGDGRRPADCNKGTGYDCIIPDAVAKNILTVGAVNKVFNYTQPSSVSMSHYSSWGPTDDGRIKPDFVAVGTDVLSTVASGTNSYASLTGTSMAAPNATGSLMLIQELHAKLNAGRFLKAATLKALAIHTVKETGSKPGPDYQFGWGLLDVKAAADLLIAYNNSDKQILESSLANSEIKQFDIFPTANKKITATLCWTDPEGSPVAPSLDPPSKMLVNDLDIRLVDEDGLVQLPWILNPSVPNAQATKGDNIRDNVEKIEFDTPLAKKYTLLVRHKGQLKFPKQDFSLILTYHEINNTSKVFYWIGGKGDWQDPTHWSLQSGGQAAGEVPQSKDVVVFDELSLENYDTISLTETVSISKIVWHSSRHTVLDIGQQKLLIGSEFSIGSKNMSIIGQGEIQFTSGSKGLLNVVGNNFGDARLIFSGDWTLTGSIQVKDIVLKDGSHTWKSKNVKINSLELQSPSVWDITGTHLEIGVGLKMPNVSFSFFSHNALILILNSGVTLDWRAHRYDGKLSIDASANVMLTGSPDISFLKLVGVLQTIGSLSVDTIELMRGSQWNLQGNTTQHIRNTFLITGSSIMKARLSSATKSFLSFEQHNKFCFDHIHITNIDIEGEAVVNVGANSILENASNWLQLLCEDVLFSDFEFTLPCANGMVKFFNKSLGIPTSYQWSFEGLSENESSSSDLHPMRVFPEVGNYSVRLSLMNQWQETSYSKQLEVMPNSIEENKVVLNQQGELMSLIQADSYQWFLNGLPLQNEVSRALNFLNQEGRYEVVISNGGCNRVSTPYLITETKIHNETIDLAPNPSDVSFQVLHTEQALTVILTDVNGIEYGSFQTNQEIPTTNFPVGMYIVHILLPSGDRSVKKLVVKH